MDLKLWWFALQKPVKENDKKVWDSFDVIAKWLISTRATVTQLTLMAGVISGLLAFRDGFFDFWPWPPFRGKAFIGVDCQLAIRICWAGKAKCQCAGNKGKFHKFEWLHRRLLKLNFKRIGAPACEAASNPSAGTNRIRFRGLTGLVPVSQPVDAGTPLEQGQISDCVLPTQAPIA